MYCAPNRLFDVSVCELVSQTSHLRRINYMSGDYQFDAVYLVICMYTTESCSVAIIYTNHCIDDIGRGNASKWSYRNELVVRTTDKIYTDSRRYTENVLFYLS